VLLNNLFSRGGGAAVRYWSPGRDRNYPTLTDPHYYPIGLNRVYGNIINGFESYVQLESDTDRSDWNVLASEGIQGTPFAFGEKGEIEMEKAAWLSIGNEANSVEAPFTFTFDPDKLELSTRGGPGAKIPAFPPLPPLLDRIPAYGEVLPTYFGGVRASRQGTNVASAARLLAADLLGNPRDPNVFIPGPLLNLPLDGTPVKVDPRHLKRDAK
jgi:hypothetical protein